MYYANWYDVFERSDPHYVDIESWERWLLQVKVSNSVPQDIEPFSSLTMYAGQQLPRYLQSPQQANVWNRDGNKGESMTFVQV